MIHDLLSSPDNSVFAINAEVKGSTLHCGALYLDPQIPFDLIRLSDNSATLDIELPEELRHQPQAIRAWNIDLKIRPDEQVQRPV